MEQRRPNIRESHRAKTISGLEDKYFSSKEGHSKFRKEHRPRLGRVKGSDHLENSE